MIRRLEFLIPAFLKRIDQQLLLRHPIVWASRVHYVLFYGGLSVLAMWMMSYLPMSQNSRPDIDQQVLIAFIPAVIGLLVWAYHVGQHRAEVLFGRQSLKQRLMAQGLFLMCISIFVSLPLVYGQSLAYRAAHSVISHQSIYDYGLPQQYDGYGQSTWEDSDPVSLNPTYHSKWSSQSWEFQEVIPSTRYASTASTIIVNIFAFMVFYGWLFFMLYARMGWKQFLGFLGIGSVGLFLLSALGGLFAFGTQDPIFVFLFYLGTVILLILPSTNFRAGEQKMYWRKMALSLAVLLTPLAIFFFGIATEFSLTDSPGFYTIGGMLLTVFLWNRLFEPQYLALHALPSIR